ncbi:hypothetical protein BaRGS_00014516, partial [Batillaria attramentaria]
VVFFSIKPPENMTPLQRSPLSPFRARGTAGMFRKTDTRMSCGDGSGQKTPALPNPLEPWALVVLSVSPRLPFSQRLASQSPCEGDKMQPGCYALWCQLLSFTEFEVTPAVLSDLSEPRARLCERRTPKRFGALSFSFTYCSAYFVNL